MPDITMCTGEGGEIREDCYRFTATPNNFRQSYFTAPPKEDGECVYFCPNSDEESEKEDVE